MNCPHCGSKMTLLFISSVCDRCEPAGQPKKILKPEGPVVRFLRTLGFKGELRLQGTDVIVVGMAEVGIIWVSEIDPEVIEVVNTFRGLKMGNNAQSLWRRVPIPMDAWKVLRDSASPATAATLPTQFTRKAVVWTQTP